MPWLKIKKAAEHAGVRQRTLCNWLKSGLRHSRLPSELLLIKDSWIDEFPEKFESRMNESADFVDSILRDFKVK